MVIGVEAFRRFALRTLDFSAFQLRSDRTDDALRNPILKIKDVVERPLIALGPQMAAACCIHELPGNAYAVGRFTHATFEDVAHAQLAAYLLHVDRSALVREARIARDHEEPANPRQ